MAQLVKNLPAMWQTWVRSLGWKDPLKKGKVTHFWPGKFHGLYSPWGHKESDTTERLSLSFISWVVFLHQEAYNVWLSLSCCFPFLFDFFSSFFSISHLSPFWQRTRRLGARGRGLPAFLAPSGGIALPYTLAFCQFSQYGFPFLWDVMVLLKIFSGLCGEKTCQGNFRGWYWASFVLPHEGMPSLSPA